MCEIDIKDKMILAVKTIISNYASIEANADEIVGCFLDDNDIDNIAQDVAVEVEAEIDRLQAENAELKEGYIKEIYGEMLPLYVDGYDIEIKSIEAIADPADSTGMNIKVFVAAYCTYLNYGEDRRRSTDKLYVIMASTNKGKDWDVCRNRNRCVIVEETWREARKTMERMYRMQREEADMFGLAYIPRKYFKIVEFSPTEVEINAKKDKTQKQ